MSDLHGGNGASEYSNSFEVEFLPSLQKVSNSEELKTVLASLEEGLKSKDLPAVNVLVLLNNLVERTDIYDLLSSETKAIGARVWSLLRHQGFQLDCPALFMESK